LKEIHVAGKPLPLNPSVFDGKHGTVLDSGTTYAYLPEAAFVAFKDAVRSVSLSLSIHSSILFFKKSFFSWILEKTLTYSCLTHPHNYK
jgi:hypothetical protein